MRKIYELHTEEQYKFLIAKMTELGLIVDGKPLSFPTFKKKLNTHVYGNSRSNLRLHFIYDHPKDSMFCFSTYVRDTKAEELKMCYRFLVDFIGGYYQDFQDGAIQWGNCGIPLSYGNGTIEYREPINS